MIGGKSAAEGNVVDGAANGIDIQGIAGVPDNSEIRFNNVGVGQDGATALHGSGAWSVGVNNADGVIIADNVVGNGESGLALANSSGLIVVRNFIGVDRKGGNQGNLNEGIDVQQTGVGKRPQNVLVSDNTISFNGLRRDHHLQRRPDDRHREPRESTTARASASTATTTRSAPATASTTTSPSTRASRCTAASATRSRRTRSTGTRASVSTLPERRHPERRWRHRHGPERPAELPGADGCVGGRRVARRDVRSRLKPNAAYTIEFFATTGSCDAGSNVEGATYLGSRVVKLGAAAGAFSATLTGPDVVGLNSDQSITATVLEVIVREQVVEFAV